MPARSSPSGTLSRTSYPDSSTARISSGRPITNGSYRIVAFSVERLTFASTTPSARRRKRSTRFTHEAHVMPSIGSVNSAVASTDGAETAEVSEAAGGNILPGSIREVDLRPGDRPHREHADDNRRVGIVRELHAHVTVLDQGRQKF